MRKHWQGSKFHKIPKVWATIQLRTSAKGPDIDPDQRFHIPGRTCFVEISAWRNVGNFKREHAGRDQISSKLLGPGRTCRFEGFRKSSEFDPCQCLRIQREICLSLKPFWQPQMRNMLKATTDAQSLRPSACTLPLQGIATWVVVGRLMSVGLQLPGALDGMWLQNSWFSIISDFKTSLDLEFRCLHQALDTCLASTLPAGQEPWPADTPLLHICCTFARSSNS